MKKKSIFAAIIVIVAAGIVLYFTNDKVQSEIDKIIGRDPLSKIEDALDSAADSVDDALDSAADSVENAID